MSNNKILINIGDLITLSPLAKEQRFTNITRDDLGRSRQCWLAMADGKIEATGPMPPPPQYNAYETIDAQNGLVMPGLIDCHTHPTYGGKRSDEFVRRLEGATYQQIGSEGGGIKKTVKMTQISSEDELYQDTCHRLKRFLRHGVTTVECKSGYGLTVEDELKMLRVLKKADHDLPMTIKSTCLALHAIPADQEKDPFIQDMTHKLLPIVAEEKLATWVDAFVEEGYFGTDDVTPFFKKAQELGLGIRIHADEFTDLSGGLLAAEWGAASVDHLEYTNEASIQAMAKSGVVAVLLPGTSIYTAIPYTKAAPFIKHGCPVALATDFNPGSCQFENLAFIATLGAIHCGLTLEQTIAAVTLVPAKSLGLERSKGALEQGFDADICIYDYQTIEDWIAFAGQKGPKAVYIAGELVAE